MKKFLAALLLVSMVGFVGCKKEETTGDKVNKAMEKGATEADKAKEAAGDAVDKVTK